MYIKVMVVLTILQGGTDDNRLMNKKLLEKSVCKMKMKLLDEDC